MDREKSLRFLENFQKIVQCQLMIVLKKLGKSEEDLGDPDAKLCIADIAFKEVIKNNPTLGPNAKKILENYHNSIANIQDLFACLAYWGGEVSEIVTDTICEFFENGASKEEYDPVLEATKKLKIMRSENKESLQVMESLLRMRFACKMKKIDDSEFDMNVTENQLNSPQIQIGRITEIETAPDNIHAKPGKTTITLGSFNS